MQKPTHVDDPLRFFTTIAHQLTTEIDKYRKVLDSRIQRNPALLRKGLDAQFRELIIEPFPELAGRNVGVQNKTVIIDECYGDLVSKSVIEYGDKILLLWAFFSRPESHIDYEFSPYSSFCPRSRCPSSQISPRPPMSFCMEW